MKSLEDSSYTAIPVINKKGMYQGTISEGDLLWSLKNDFDYDEAVFLNTYLSKILKKNKYKPIRASEKTENLFEMVTNQNFVPVIDDDDVFIGIVKRRDVIKYYVNHEE